MNHGSTVTVPDELYENARQYLPAHWFNVLFDKPHTNKSDATNRNRYHRLILANDANYAKVLADCVDLYDNSWIVVIGSTLLLAAVTGIIISVLSSYLSGLETTMVGVIIVIITSHMYSRSEVLRVKKEFAINIVYQLAGY